MEVTVFLARLIGPFMVTVGLGLLISKTAYRDVMEDFFKNAALVYLGGIMAFFMGLTVVLFHNVWISGWPVIITFFGWAAVIKGIWLIVFPKMRGKIAEAYLKHAGLLSAHAVIMIALGAFLSYKGYF